MSKAAKAAKKNGKAEAEVAATEVANPLQALATYQSFKKDAVKAAKQLLNDARKKVELYNVAAEELRLDLYDVVQITGLKQASQQPKPAKKGEGKRHRRSEDQVKWVAETALEALKKAGAEGMAAGEIQQAVDAQKGTRFFSTEITGAADKFIKKALGVEIKAQGNKRDRRYFYVAK